MEEDNITLTPDGYESLKEEYEKLTKEDMPQVVKEMDEARQLGDLRENDAYQSARHRQAMVKGRIEELEHILKNATIVEDDDTPHVTLGSAVNVKTNEEEKEFKIVGEHEANVRKGKISSSSPLGQALMGKAEGDTITLDLPAGSVEYQIISIK